MPELPEVHTTVEGIKKQVVGKTIKDTWSDFHIGTTHGDRQTIKNKKYFDNFKKIIKGAKVISSERRGKNILIHLNNPSNSSGQDGHTIIIHMKMTGHLMVGKYRFQNSSWLPLEKGPLQDPYNKYIHFTISLSNGKTLVLSDMRKFASVCIEKTSELHKHERLQSLGEDALKINFEDFKKRIKSKNNWPIKSTLMDQTVLAGVGNIYSDETLWETSVHPLSHSKTIPDKKLKDIYLVMKKILKFSIQKGGDSKSDYRNINGERGGFQDFHKVYSKKGKKCPKSGCKGIIIRTVVKGRSSHYCPKHQKIYN